MLREAQHVTEDVMRRACELIARSDTYDDGTLQVEGQLLTSERVQSLIDVWLLEKGYGESTSIVAGGVQGSDCHSRGSGALRSCEPIIVDIFSARKTQQVLGRLHTNRIHGQVPEQLDKMHKLSHKQSNLQSAL